MQNTLIFSQFDAVVSISQKTINDQLLHLVKTGVIKSRLIIVQEIQGSDYVYRVQDENDLIPPGCAYINGKIDPQIKIHESGSNIIFLLNFFGGEAAFWVGNGPLAKLQLYDMTNWSYGLNMNLDLYALEKKDINSKILMPESLAAQLNDFLDNMFTVNSLFLDFENTNLLDFNPLQTNAGNAGDAGEQQFILFMQFYLQQLIKNGNPYVLGYGVNATDTTVVPQNLVVPDALKFTGTDYTMYKDPVNDDLSNLNFTLVTKGGFGCIKNSPDKFDSNWISAGEQCNAKLIYARQDLVETLVLQPFYNSLQSTVYDQIKNYLKVDAGNSYAQARSFDGENFNYTISDFSDDDNKYLNKFFVSFQNDQNTAGIVMKGEVYVRKDIYKNLGCEAHAHTAGTFHWSITIYIDVTKDPNGNPVLEIKKTPVTFNSNTESGQNTCAKDMGDILALIDALMTMLSGFDSKVMTLLFETLLFDYVPMIGNVSTAFNNLGNNISSNILLPAGQTFFFKNPSFDADGNFYLELTYISNQ